MLNSFYHGAAPLGPFQICLPTPHAEVKNDSDDHYATID